MQQQQTTSTFPTLGGSNGNVGLAQLQSTAGMGGLVFGAGSGTPSFGTTSQGTTGGDQGAAGVSGTDNTGPAVVSQPLAPTQPPPVSATLDT